MAEPLRSYDVWIVQSNTVYKDVPFEVAADWLQQGRLLDDDRARPTGGTDWQRVGDLPFLQPYAPRAEPMRVEDRAEALEPVAFDFGWHKRSEDEDEDVDMIPLIDVSLVLLIFFMMTATVSSVAFSRRDLPGTSYGAGISSDPETVWISVSSGEGDGAPRYAIGQGEKPPAREDKDLSDESQALAKIDERLQNGPINVRIAAQKQLPFEVVQKLTAALETRKGRGEGGGIRDIKAEVNEVPR